MAALRTAFDAAARQDLGKKAPKDIKDDYAILQEYVDLRFQAVVDPSKAACQPRITEITPKYRRRAERS